MTYWDNVDLLTSCECDLHFDVLAIMLLHGGILKLSQITTV